MSEIRLSIDGIEVEAKKGQTILKAAESAALYIPALCAHPSLLPAWGIISAETVFRGEEAIRDSGNNHEFQGCQLCVVEIEGREGTCTACNTPAGNGMKVHTNTPGLQELRRENLAKILANHPHACLTCPLREGCSLTQCSSNIPKNERCCPKFSNCEFRKLVEYVGIKKDTPRYLPGNLPVIDSEPLILFDYNLCVGCLRCIRACQDLAKAGVLGFVYRKGDVLPGTTAPNLKESGCKFCGACIEVCPTGALMDKSEKARAIRSGKLNISPAILPPIVLLKFDAPTVATVPQIEGVYQILDEEKKVIYIKGTGNLHRELEEQLKTNKAACYFKWEEEPMYTRRESELIQQFLQTYNRLPLLNDEFGDLF